MISKLAVFRSVNEKSHYRKLSVVGFKYDNFPRSRRGLKHCSALDGTIEFMRVFRRSRCIQNNNRNES